MTITSRASKRQKMAEDSNDELRYNLPNCLISDHILPFVDRSTWDNLIVANREIYQRSRNLEAPWPVGDLSIRTFGYEEDEEDEEDEFPHDAIQQLCFSSDGKHLCVRSDQRIRMWHNVVGSCGHISFDVSDGFAAMFLWSFRFSPVENLLVSLHDDDVGSNAFRLWEFDTGGLVLKVEVRLREDVFSCVFSRDGRQLILSCEGGTLRIYSVPDAQLIKVIHLVGDRRGRFRFVGITADGDQVVCIECGIDHTNRRVCLWDFHGDGSTFEEVYVYLEGEQYMSKIAISPLDDSIAIMTETGIIKLAHRCARDMAWTVKVVADGKCFDMTGEMSFSTSGQLLATVRMDGGVEIWDPIKGECLRTIVGDQLSMFRFSPDGSLLAAATSSNHRLCLYNIWGVNVGKV
jgi:WD40 repeat protein